MEFVYVQVNETQTCIYRTYKHHLVVVLEILFHNEIIYEMGSSMLGKQVKESQSNVVRPSLRPSGGRGMTYV